MQRLVDSHVHVWDLERLRLGWLDSVPALNRTIAVSDYLDATASSTVDLASVYLEVDVIPEDRERELEFVGELVADETTPFEAGVVACDPASSQIDEWVDRASRVGGVRGFRMVLHTPEVPRGLCLDPAFVRGIQVIGAAGMHFELCMREEELLEGAELARVAPETRFVLDHFGNPKLDGRDLRQWRDSLARVAEEPNIMCKVSGLLQNMDGPARVDEFEGIVEHARACFGVERLMFGSNWPVCGLGDSICGWLDALDAITSSWSEEDRGLLFEGNATRFYGLA